MVTLQGQGGDFPATKKALLTPFYAASYLVN
jgi:hypothetical protein